MGKLDKVRSCLTIERSLAFVSIVSLAFGFVLFIVGGVVRFNFSGYLHNFIADLNNPLPDDVCTEKATRIDFCESDYSDGQIYLGKWVNNLGSIFIITGFFVTMASVLGFGAGVRTMSPLLIMVILSVSISIALEIYIIDIVTNSDSTFHSAAKDSMVEVLKAEYLMAYPKKDSFTQVLNFLMLQVECCGVNGRKDFAANITYVREDGFIYIFEGCYGELYNHLYHAYGVLVHRSLLYLIVWHVMALILSILVLVRPDSDTRHRIMEKISTHGSTSFVGRFFHDVSKINLYPKSSSHTGKPGLRRGKSTEVW